MREAKGGVYTAWIIVSPAEDLPGTWAAHALEFDVVSQGTSAEDALRMASEAVAMVLSDDVGEGFDPYRRRAPAECWQQLHTIMEHGVRIDGKHLSEKIRESHFDALAVMMWFKHIELPKAPTTARKQYDAPLAIASHASAAHC